MAVESTITSINAPPSVDPDLPFTIEVFITTSGTGCDKLFLAFWDNDLGQYVAAGKSDECWEPGMNLKWTAKFNPLSSWYPTAVPSTLSWVARVGYVTEEHPDGTWSGVQTDERPFSIPVAEKACEDYTNQADCEAAGCYWYNGVCHSAPPGMATWKKLLLVTTVGAGCAGLVWYAAR